MVNANNKINLFFRIIKKNEKDGGGKINYIKKYRMILYSSFDI